MSGRKMAHNSSSYLLTRNSTLVRVPPFFRCRAQVNTVLVPRLMSQLFESEIFIQIGDRHFQIPRDIFSSPGDSPNFFTLGFGAFFASPSEVFPGLSRQGLLRPPAIVPPSVPNRSADVFADLLHILRGYPLHIRNEEHRAELLRDCRYFHLRGVEQKLIPHRIRHNAFTRRSEIVVRVEDIRPSGVHVAEKSPGALSGDRYVTYARPFVDEKPSDLILEIGGECTFVLEHALVANFHGQTKDRMASLLQLVGNKATIPHSQFANLPVRVRFGMETDLTLNGERDSPLRTGAVTPEDTAAPPAKRPRSDNSDNGAWLVRTGQWRLEVHYIQNNYEPVLVAVKLDAWTSHLARNRGQGFL